MDHFDVPASAASLVGSSLAGMTLLYGPVCGYLVNKLGVRSSIIVGSAITSISCLICGLFWKQLPFVAFVAVYGLVLGLGFGMLFVPALTTCSFFFIEKQALATEFAMSGTGIGIAILPAIVDRVNHYCGLGNLFLILAPVMGLMMGMAILFPTANEIADRSKLIIQFNQQEVNEPKLIKYTTKSIIQPANSSHKEPGIDSLGPPGPFRQSSLFYHVHFTKSQSIKTERCKEAKFLFGARDLLLLLVKDPKLYLSCTCYCLLVTSTFVTAFYLPSFANYQFGKSQLSSYVMLAMGITNTVSRVVSGYMVTKVSFITPNCLLPFAIVLAALSMFIMPMCTNAICLVVAGGLFGVAFGLYVSMLVPFLSSLYPVTQLNIVLGWNSFFMGVGALSGGPLVGFIKEVYKDDYQTAFAIGEQGGGSGGVLPRLKIFFMTPL